MSNWGTRCTNESIVSSGGAAFKHAEQCVYVRVVDDDDSCRRIGPEGVKGSDIGAYSCDPNRVFADADFSGVGVDSSTVAPVPFSNTLTIVKEGTGSGTAWIVKSIAFL